MRETHLNIKTMTCVRAASTGAVIAALLVCATAPAMAETVTLKGRGTYFVKRNLMPLSNGGAALHTTNTTVVSVEPSESGVMFGECAGLAYLAPDATVSSRVFCNFSENGKDSFVVQGELSPDGGAIKVIGGSGKWKDATGTGSISPLSENDAEGRYSYEFTITTP